MPSYYLKMTITVVPCYRDTVVVSNRGSHSIKAGQYVGQIGYNGDLAVFDPEEVANAIPASPDEMDSEIERQLMEALEKGRW